MNRNFIKELRLLGILAGMLAVIVVFALTAQAEPNGVSTNEISNERAPNDSAGSDEAYAGNVTNLDLTAFSVTQAWQGYHGNVSGTIFLADSDDNQLYNWTPTTIQGEVYASSNQTITWTSIQCLNYTATGAEGGAGGEVAGNISLTGVNLTTLESRYNINESDADGVNETFTLEHGGAGEHDEFFTGSLQFEEGECISTRVFTNTGPQANNFEEVLLYEPDTRSVVFTALLEDDATGFDTATHDFEMLVLEDGHDSDIATTTYYFFAEIE